MDRTKTYLQILSGVMQERQQVQTPERGNYIKLCKLFHEDLNDRIKDAQYPDAPRLMRKADALLDDMEPFFVCPEIIGKRCVRIAAHYTNTIFDGLNSVFIDHKFVYTLKKCYTQIPFIIYNGDTNRIETLNYANGRAELLAKDLKLLLTESGRNKVALNKIVKAFVIQTPLVGENTCFLFDNVYADLNKMFGHYVGQNLRYIERLDELKNWLNDLISAKETVCVPNDVMETVGNSLDFSGIKLVSGDTITSFAQQKVAPVLCGYMDTFYLLRAYLNVYYNNGIEQSRRMVRNLSSDKVRMNTKDSILEEMLHNEQCKGNKLKTEKKEIDIVLNDIEACMEQAVKGLQDIMTSDKYVPRNVWDTIFERFFLETPCDIKARQELSARLKLLEYTYHYLVSAYFDALDGKNDITTCLLQPGDWEKAKMLIEIWDLSKIDQKKCAEFVKIAGKKHLVTGKELFAKALTLPRDKCIPLLYNSFAKGYTPAGTELFRLYQCGEKVNLRTLVNALLPEACMIEGGRNKRRPINNLTAPGLTYYKIAASCEYLPAIGKIIELLYYSKFSQARVIERQGDKKTAYIICELCHYLLDKNYQVEHYREIYGVMLFSLGEDFSSAMNELGGINTGVAHYCKGFMYELGKGTTRNLDNAVQHYQQAWKLGFATTYMERRINVCKAKKSSETERQQRESHYHEDKKYISTNRETSRTESGCFITTAACRALQAADDCEELQLLRSFRDAHIGNTEEGAAIVREYYRVGPLIVSEIAKLPDSDALYQRLWEQYIQPSCTEICLQHWDIARSIYVEMVVELCRRFQIQIDSRVCTFLNQQQNFLQKV